MNWTEGRLNLLGFITKRNTTNAASAQVARERLHLLLAHKPGAGGSGEHSQLVAVLQEEILAVIARHMQIDRDKVVVKLDRAEEVSMLEIDIEMPPQAGEPPLQLRAQA